MEGGDVFILAGEIPPALSFFHALTIFFFLFFFFLITVYPVAWQADGSDYSVIINHGRKPWERRLDDRMREGGESEILWGLTGQHTCRSCPRISACAYFHHLDGSDLHQTKGKVIKNYDSARKTFFFFFFAVDAKSLIFVLLNPIEQANVAYFEAWSWKMKFPL